MSVMLPHHRTLLAERKRRDPLAGALNMTPFGAIPQKIFAFTGGKTSFVGEYTDHLCFKTLDNKVYLVFDNFYLVSGSGITGPGAGMTRTFNKVSLQKKDRSRQVDCLASPLTLQPSDAEVIVEVTVPFDWNNGDPILVRVEGAHGLTTGNCISFFNRMDADSKFYTYFPGNRIDQCSNLAPIVAPIGAVASTGLCVGPSFICGLPVGGPSSVISVGVIGDSIITDGRDNTSAGHAPGGIGLISHPAGQTFMARAMNDGPSDGASISNLWALGRLGCQGATLNTTFGGGAKGQKSTYPIDKGYFTHVCIEMGTNGSDATSNLIAQRRTVVANAYAGGARAVIPFNLLPRSTGRVTPTAADGSDQTYDAVVGGVGGRADGVNQDNEAMLIAGLVPATARWSECGIRLPADYFKVINDGLWFDCVTDTSHSNLHPLPPANIAMAPELRGAIFLSEYNVAHGGFPGLSAYNSLYTAFYRAVRDGTPLPV